MNNIKINSKEYWNRRFNDDWKSKLGKEQSRYFAKLTIDHLPSWFLKTVQTQKLSLCDWGCAEGDGTNVLAGQFERNCVAGVDFSDVAIHEAQLQYPHIQFYAKDWLTEISPEIGYDIIFSSNTLEHFHDPFIVLKRLLSYASKCVVLLLPYREFKRHQEHHYTFSASNLSFTPAKNYVLAHTSIIDSKKISSIYWCGQQALLIYAQIDWLAKIDLTLADINIQDEKQINLLDKLLKLKKNIEEKEIQKITIYNRLLETEKSLIKNRKEKNEIIEQQVEIKKNILTQSQHIYQLKQALQFYDVQGIRNYQKLTVAQDKISALSEKIKDLNFEADSFKNELITIKNTRGWKYLTAIHKLRKSVATKKWMFFYKVKKLTRIFIICIHYSDTRKIFKFLRYVKYHGFSIAFNKTRSYFYRLDGFHEAQQSEKGLDIRQNKYYNELKIYLRNKSYAGVYVMGSRCMGWHEVFKQRPHHIADYMMAKGYIVICAMNPIYPEDYTNCLKRDKDNLFIVNFDSNEIWNQIIDLLAIESKAPLIYHLVGTEPGTTKDDIATLKKLGYLIYYDYIDEISSDISPGLGTMCLERHRDLLKDEEILLVASSDNLYKTATKYRSANTILVPNGVRLEDWVINDDPPVPQELKVIIEQKKPIAGYYGNFATWMNYKFIIALSKNRPNINIVMIGHDYDFKKGDFSESRISELPNVYILPAKKYCDLKYFSRFFDIGIIPFREYELTKSVSPVKMFEYMAQGIPVVATGLQECKKYSSCLNAENDSDFIQKVDQALTLINNSDYLNLLSRDAQDNTWEVRGKAIYLALSDMMKRFSGKLLSIIIPTYNMDNLLSRCLDSMLVPSQLSRLEIIVVNDGSQDDSLAIAKDYEQKYQNTIRVIDKKNGGHGSCINVGISQASGKFFKIVDADDWLTPRDLILHLNFLERASADMVVTNYLRVYDQEEGELISYSERLEERDYSIYQFYEAMTIDHSCFSYAHMHAITYRTDILRKNKLKITEKSFYVDQEYISLPHQYINSVTFEDIVLYRYHIGRLGQSVAPDMAKKKSYDNYKILKNIFSLIESFPLHAISRRYILNIAFHQTWFYLTHSVDNQIKQSVMDWWHKENRALSDELNKNFMQLS